MLANAKRVFLFVGMVVGAGFATGRELMLYFNGKSISTVILAGMIMGLCFGVFLYIGSKSSYQYMKNTPLGKVVAFIMYLSVIASFVAMVSGAEELLFDIFNVRFLGVLTGVFCAIFSMFNMNKLKNINMIIVPLLIVLVLFVTRNATSEVIGKFSFFTSLRYVGMNMLMAGYLILEEGEKVSPKDIVISSLLVALIFSLMLSIIVKGVWIYAKVAMPLYVLAITKGLREVGGIMIYLAILSTLLGDAKLIYDGTYNAIGYRKIAVIFIVMLSVVAFFIPFESTLNVVYSIEGVIGVLFMLYVLISHIVIQYNTHKKLRFE